jgi:MFS family permease
MTAQYSKFRWFVLVAIVLVTASTSSILISPAPLIPTIFTSMNWNPGVATAAAMLTFQITLGVAALLSGILIDKIGPIKSWLVGEIIIIIGCALEPVLSYSVGGFVFCRILNGIGTAPVMGSIASVCAERFPAKERTYAAAAQGLGVSTGIAIGLVFSPWMLNNAGGNWHMALAYDALLPVLGIVLALVVLFGPKQEALEEHIVADANIANRSADIKKAITYSTFWILALMAFVDSWAQQAYQDIAPGFYAAAAPLGLGFDPLTAGSLLSLASFAMMAGTVVSPFLTEKVFKGNPKPTVFIGLLISAISVMGVRFMTHDSGSLLVIVPCCILFFSSFVNPTVYGYLAKNYPAHITGKLGGFVMGLGVFGAAIGVALGSILLGTFNSYLPNMDVLTGLMFVGALIVWFLRKPKGFE